MRRGPVMSSFLNHSHAPDFNIGAWVSAKIYSDMKDGCPCGVDDWTRAPIRELPEYDEPICSSCKKRPTSYVIAATVEDEDGLKKRIKIRHSQEGERLKDIFDVIFTLRTVNKEIKAQCFDVGKYMSKTSRESYIFGKIVEAYLDHHEKRKLRGELTPGGLRDKKSLIDNHLQTFNEVDVGLINSKRIKAFHNSYTDRLRTRDKATAELKTILKFAMEDGKIHKMPDFPELAESKMVSSDNFLDMEKQELVLSKIENPLYQAAIRTMALFALRPCDVRSLKWEDIDFKKKIFFVRSHISGAEDIKGRKSQADAVHTLPFEDDFEEILCTLPRAINPKDYVFRGVQGGPIGANVLTRAWNAACKIAKVKGVKMYWGTKHSTLTEYSKTLSDSQMIRLTGHSSTKMIRRYAQTNVEDLRRMLN